MVERIFQTETLYSVSQLASFLSISERTVTHHLATGGIVMSSASRLAILRGRKINRTWVVTEDAYRRWCAFIVRGCDG